MPSLTDWSSIAIKLRIGNHVRRIPAQRLLTNTNDGPSLSMLEKICINFFLEQQALLDPQTTQLPDDHNEFKVMFTYLDEENDTIVFSTDVEFLEALQFSSVVTSTDTSSSGHDAIRFLRIIVVMEPFSSNTHIICSKLLSTTAAASSKTFTTATKAPEVGTTTPSKASLSSSSSNLLSLEVASNQQTEVEKGARIGPENEKEVDNGNVNECFTRLGEDEESLHKLREEDERISEEKSKQAKKTEGEDLILFSTMQLDLRKQRASALISTEQVVMPPGFCAKQNQTSLLAKLASPACHSPIKFGHSELKIRVLDVKAQQQQSMSPISFGVLDDELTCAGRVTLPGDDIYIIEQERDSSAPPFGGCNDSHQAQSRSNSSNGSGTLSASPKDIQSENNPGRSQFDDPKCSPNPLEAVSSFFQKAGQFAQNFQIPINDIEGRKTTLGGPVASLDIELTQDRRHDSNTLSPGNCVHGGNRRVFNTLSPRNFVNGSEKNLSNKSTEVPRTIPFASSQVLIPPGNTPGRVRVADARDAPMHPLDIVSSLIQKAGHFVQTIQNSPPNRCEINNKVSEEHVRMPRLNYEGDKGCFLGFDPNFVHARHQCDLCKCHPIVGFRWHAMCPPLKPNVCASIARRFVNFDLCQQCYTRFRENLDERSRSFEIPSELRFRPVQYDRDCDFFRQRHTNPLEMCVRKIVHFRFPQEPPAIRLVDCAEVNEGIHKSLQELHLRSHYARFQKTNPTCQPFDCDHKVDNSMEQSVPFDVRPLLHVNVNSTQEDQSSLMTGDEDSLQSSTILQGVVEIAPSVNSSCIADFCELADAATVESTEASFAVESNNMANPLDLINEKNGNERKRSFIHLVEETTEEEAELNVSYTSITLGSMTVSSVTDTSNGKLGDDVSIKNEDSNATNISLYLSAYEGEECTIPVSEFDVLPIVPLVQSVSDSESSKEADSSNRSEGDMDGWDLVSDEEIFAYAFQSIGSSMFNSSTSGLSH